MFKEEKLMKLLAPYLSQPESDRFFEKIGRTREKFHRFIYKDAPQILAHPKDYGLPDELCEKIDALASSNLDPVVYWDKNTSFNKASNVLTVFIPSYHCVSVHKRKDEDFESITTDFIGGHYLELDLSPKGEKAFLRSSKGEIEIKIKDSKIEPDRIVVGKSGKKDIVVGDVYDEVTDEGYYMAVSDFSAKERLIHFLAYPQLPSYEIYLNKGRDDDITCSYLCSIMTKIADAYKLYPKSNHRKDIETLKKRPDFAYDKDFSYIYDSTVYPAIHSPVKSQSR